jgi:signal transduction histidine kinase
MIDRLAEARARIEANDHQRRQLFADITHELATPLTSIRGYAETLLNPDVATSPEERERFLRGIRAEAERLDRLTRDIFELARLEAAATRLQPEPLDWAALCRNTLERFDPRIRGAGLRASWRGPLQEAWIEADGHRMVQVLENLLTNAIRYVPPGGSIDLCLESDGSGAYRLTVEDDGPGLPAESLPRLFERFYRAPRSQAGRANGNAEGSGLGLAIVSAIVSQHGGSVEARAREPRGLSISVVIPRRVSGAPR